MAVNMRTTNNSVASLEEQSQLLNTVLDKDSKKAKVTKKPAKKSRSPLEKLEKKMKKTSTSPAVLETEVEEDSVHGEHLDLPDEYLDQQGWSTIPTDYQMYGNFVPNYVLGQGPTQFYNDHQVSEAESESEYTTIDGDGEEGSDTTQDHKVEETVIPEIKSKGKFADILKKEITQVKEADKLSSNVSPAVAMALKKSLSDCVYVSEMEKLTKAYPRVENVPNMKVPKLDSEVFQLVDQRYKSMDQSIQSIQKAVMGSLAAFAPVLELIEKRGDEDKELDEIGQNLIDGVHLLSYAVNGLSNRRREILKPCIAPAYTKVLTKGHETTPEWLFGGDLLNTTKKCEAAKKIGEKVLKRKNMDQNKGRFGNAKRFRMPNHTVFTNGPPMLRGYNPYQQFRFQNPQSFQQNHPQYIQQAGYQWSYPRQQKPRQYGQGNQMQQQQQQGFPKKTNYQK